MGKRSIISLFGVLATTLIFISACQNPGSSIEESVAPYLELQEVNGASNVTMTVNRGSAQGLDSYFAVDFANFDSNGIVPEGLSEGWCLDHSKPIDQNNDVHAGVKMFNTFGSENWKPANYLMTIKDDLQEADPSLTYKEIQVALWSLIKVPAFDIDKAISEGTMPSRMLTNGAPNFSVEKAKAIVKKVQSEADDFVYKPGTPVIVYSKTSDDQQPVGGVFGESAWAYTSNTDGSVNTTLSNEFCGENDLGINKWGWTNGTFTSGSSGTFDIIAGAGQCDVTKGKHVGTFSFTYQGGKLDYTLDLTVDNDFKDLHIHAGTDPLPKKKNGNGNKNRNGNGNGNTSSYTAAPGQFEFGKSITSGVGITEGLIDISGEIYIAVHLGG